MTDHDQPDGPKHFTHLNEKGEANMVDVSGKAATVRVALAGAEVVMAEATMTALRDSTVAKGDVLSVARIAGIQAAKRTSELIPLCHPLALSRVSVDFAELDDRRLGITAECRLTGQTGVEMEALTAVSIAALTVYDMCKALDKGMTINNVRLLKKEGGKSGDWHRQE